MATRDLQTLNLKFDQVILNSLVFMWERNFEATFGIFSGLVTQINVLESYLEIYLFIINYDQKWENCDHLNLKSKLYLYFVLTKKLLYHLAFLVCEIPRRFERSSPSYFRTQDSFIHKTVGKFSNATFFHQIALQNLQRKNLGFSETVLIQFLEQLLTFLVNFTLLK